MESRRSCAILCETASGGMGVTRAAGGVGFEVSLASEGPFEEAEADADADPARSLQHAGCNACVKDALHTSVRTRFNASASSEIKRGDAAKILRKDFGI